MSQIWPDDEIMKLQRHYDDITNAQTDSLRLRPARPSETLAASMARAKKWSLVDNNGIAAFSRHQKRIHQERLARH